MKRKYLILFSLSGLIISTDQLLKQWFHSHIPLNSGFEFIPGLIRFSHRQNTGFAFGAIDASAQSFNNIFMLGVPAFALILMVLIFIKLRDNQMVTSVALTSVLSGAVGNLIDRVQHGYVVDYLEVHLGKSQILPSLNLADVAIISGVLLMLFNTIRQEFRKNPNE